MKDKIFIGAMLKMTSREIEQNMNAKVTALGLTAAQSHILHYICRNSGAVHQKDVESRFDLSHATVSGIIDRLEGKGLVRREKDGADGRLIVLCAAEKALEYEDAVHGYITECEAQMLQGFSEEETLALCGYLKRILDNLGFDPQNHKCSAKEAHPC